MQHGEQQVGQRIVPVLIAVEAEVLSVSEAASGEKNGQIIARVQVGIAEIGTIEDHCPIQQRVPSFVDGLHVAIEFP